MATNGGIPNASLESTGKSDFDQIRAKIGVLNTQYWPNARPH